MCLASPAGDKSLGDESFNIPTAVNTDGETFILRLLVRYFYLFFLLFVFQTFFHSKVDERLLDVSISTPPDRTFSIESFDDAHDNDDSPSHFPTNIPKSEHNACERILVLEA